MPLPAKQVKRFLGGALRPGSSGLGHDHAAAHTGARLEADLGFELVGPPEDCLGKFSC
jgi:hypothetical protein